MQLLIYYLSILVRVWIVSHWGHLGFPTDHSFWKAHFILYVMHTKRNLFYIWIHLNESSIFSFSTSDSATENKSFYFCHSIDFPLQGFLPSSYYLLGFVLLFTPTFMLSAPLDTKVTIVLRLNIWSFNYYSRVQDCTHRKEFYFFPL